MRPAPLLSRLSAVAIAASQLVAGCQRQQAPPPAPDPPVPAASPAPAPPLAPAALDRAELLNALDQAASAHAEGRLVVAEDVAGRRFVIRQAFGCDGPTATAPPGLARWTWGRDRRTIEISLLPADLTKDEIFSLASSPWEAVEGYWITRPWMRAGGCPALTAAEVVPAEPVPPPSPLPKNDASVPVAEPQSAGLAAVFARGGSRVGRRDGKPFTFSLRSEGAPTLEGPRNGYRLVLEGRLAAFPDGGAIRCRAASTDARPVCVAAAEVDRVAFEDAEGKLLREWRPG